MDKPLQEAGFIYQSAGLHGSIPQIGLGIEFDGQTEGTTLPPPKLGAHTEQVLREWLRCAPQDIEHLRATRVI